MHQLQSLSYYFGWTLGVLPGLASFAVIKFHAGEPWNLSNLLAGCALIGIAISMVVLLTNWEDVVVLLQNAGKITEAEHQVSKSSSALWLIVIPLVFGGVGVNVISAWLQSKHPPKPPVRFDK